MKSRSPLRQIEIPAFNFVAMTRYSDETQAQRLGAQYLM
jgi:hypothetical protein